MPLPRALRATLLLIVLPLLATGAHANEPTALGVESAARFAELALKCLHTEYPNHLSLGMEGDTDLRPPHVLTPAFYGCFDWHSDVHGHWLLVRLLRLDPQASFAARARAELDKSFTPTNMAAELQFMRHPQRASFERPYGLAWILKLAAELRQWNDPDAKRWSDSLKPLEVEAAARIIEWLPKLQYPIRIGEHDQTAFSFSLIWDWAGVVNDVWMRRLLTDTAARFYLRDRDCPLRYEPSGQDFLSPCLSEADFMRRVLDSTLFERWLAVFMPDIPRRATAWLAPAMVTDRADPKLAHLDGLNLSRSWMLQGIAASLAQNDRRRVALLSAARAHRDASLPFITGEHYEGGHWLGTFAVYLTSEAWLN